jgi:hypothetical protein
MQGLYDMEYVLRKNLQLGASDFNTLSFPECNILIKMFKKDQEVETKTSSESVDIS